jgi:hypothetical protein
MIALSLCLCKPLFRCRPATALCHRDRAGQAAGPVISAMPRKRQLAVKMAPVAMGQWRTSDRAECLRHPHCYLVIRACRLIAIDRSRW